MDISKGTKSVLFLGVTSLVLYLFILYFRAFIYSDLYIAPDDPYGVADIIELLLGLIMVLLFIASACVAIYLLAKGCSQSKISAILLILFWLALYLSFSPLHTLAAQYGSSY
mgnify:CR=1 FL=1